MKNEESIWERVSSEYVRNVERALAQVKHPRKAKVIEDVRAHLDEAYRNIQPDRHTPEEFQAVVERMGPPEDYADLLADEPCPAGRHWSLKHVLSLLALAAVPIAAYVLLWGSPWGKSRTLWLLGRGYSAPPFFTVEGFQTIKPGMSAAQVRDTLGYPFRRDIMAGSENEARWIYSDVPFKGARMREEFRVFISQWDKSVLRTEKFECTVAATDGPDLVPPRDLAAVPGPVTLSRPDGSKRVLGTADAGMYFITCDVESRPRELRELFEYGEKRARDLLAAAGVTNAEVIHVYSGGRADAYAAALPQAYTGWSLSQMPDRMAIHAQGKTYFVPPVFSGLCAEDFQEDQVWLVKKLSQGAK